MAVVACFDCALSYPRSFSRCLAAPYAACSRRLVFCLGPPEASLRRVIFCEGAGVGGGDVCVGVLMVLLCAH